MDTPYRGTKVDDCSSCVLGIVFLVYCRNRLCVSRGDSQNLIIRDVMVLEKKWYVIRAVSGQENKVKSYIETEINRFGYSDYVEEVLVPTEKVPQVRNGKKINKERVFFPGYVMVKANLAGEVVHIIKSISGVIGFLGETKGGDPIPMRKSEVNRMLGVVDELSEKIENVLIPYEVGETIKVIDGPFNGFNGVVEKINEEKRKLEVMVKIFGRKTPLDLSYMQVEKV